MLFSCFGGTPLLTPANPACRCRRDWVRNEGDSTAFSRLFYAKQLIVVVAGQVIDSQARKRLQEKVEADGWRVWLPDGSGLELGDACFGGACGEGLEGSRIHMKMMGRSSLPSSAATAVTPCHARADFSRTMNRQAFQLPGRRVQCLPSSRLSMGGSTLKLGWR